MHCIGELCTEQPDIAPAQLRATVTHWPRCKAKATCRYKRLYVPHGRRRWEAAAASAGVAERLRDAACCGSPATFALQQICQIMPLACADPERLELPISRWSQSELDRQAVKRAIVKSISHGSVGRFLTRCRLRTPRSAAACRAARTRTHAARPGVSSAGLARHITAPGCRSSRRSTRSARPAPRLPAPLGRRRRFRRTWIRRRDQASASANSGCGALDLKPRPDVFWSPIREFADGDAGCIPRGPCPGGTGTIDRACCANSLRPRALAISLSIRMPTKKAIRSCWCRSSIVWLIGRSR